MLGFLHRLFFRSFDNGKNPLINVKSPIRVQFDHYTTLAEILVRYANHIIYPVLYKLLKLLEV